MEVADQAPDYGEDGGRQYQAPALLCRQALVPKLCALRPLLFYHAQEALDRCLTLCLLSP